MKKRAHADLYNIDELWNGTFLETPTGKMFMLNNKIITRVRVYGIITQMYISENKDFFAFILDDGTDSIRLKFWKRITNEDNGVQNDNSIIVKDLNKGDLIDVIGRVRQNQPNESQPEYNDEIFIVPENIKKQNRMDWELNRRAKILELKVQEKGLLDHPAEESSSLLPIDKVLNVFSPNTSENTVDSLAQRAGLSSEVTLKIIKQLQSETRILNPNPGFYQLIE